MPKILNFLIGFLVALIFFLLPFAQFFLLTQLLNQVGLVHGMGTFIANALNISTKTIGLILMIIFAFKIFKYALKD